MILLARDAGLAALRQRGMRFMVPSFTLLLAFAALGRAETTHLAPDLAALETDLAQGERWLIGACRSLRRQHQGLAADADPAA